MRFGDGSFNAAGPPHHQVMLYANAGSKLCDNIQHVISIDELRGNPQRGGERVKDSILRLMKTIVTVPDFDRRGCTAGQNCANSIDDHDNRR